MLMQLTRPKVWMLLQLPRLGYRLQVSALVQVVQEAQVARKKNSECKLQHSAYQQTAGILRHARALGGSHHMVGPVTHFLPTGGILKGSNPHPCFLVPCRLPAQAQAPRTSLHKPCLYTCPNLGEEQIALRPAYRQDGCQVYSK